MLNQTKKAQCDTIIATTTNATTAITNITSITMNTHLLRLRVISKSFRKGLGQHSTESENTIHVLVIKVVCLQYFCNVLGYSAEISRPTDIYNTLATTTTATIELNQNSSSVSRL